MKILTGLFILTGSFCFGQVKQIQNIAADVSIERLKKNLYYLASDSLEGRLMGSHGDTLASEYVISCFKENHLSAPFKKGTSYYQPIQTYRKNLLQSELIIGNKKYENWDGWNFSMRTAETVNMDNIPVVFAGYGIENTNYNDFAGIDVKGKAVLLLGGQPQDSAGIYLLSGTKQPAVIPAYQNVLREKGAVMVLMYSNRFRSDSTQQRRTSSQPVFKNPFIQNNNLPVLTLSEDRVNEILAVSGKTIKNLVQEITKTLKPGSFHVGANAGVHIKIDLTEGTAPNVIGFIKGTDPAADCIILSAHHDHLGKDDRNNVYYGAVDNASGTVAIMEIAALMNEAREKGLKPKRTIVFASYTGEEKGELGSYYLAANPIFPIEKTWAVLNFDMLGRVDTFYSGRRADSSYAYFLVKDSLNRGLRTALFSANEKLGKLKLDPYYEQPQFMQRRLSGSDHYPFYLKGVPIIRIDCGFSKDYHRLTDTPDKINYELLSDQVKLAFLTAWNLANN